MYGHIPQQSDNRIALRFLPVLLAGTVVLSGCGWVDSTGRSDPDADGSLIGVSPATSDSGDVQNTDTFVDLPETRIIQIQESGSVRVIPDERVRNALDWTWTPVASGNPLVDCNRLNDFNAAIASTNISSSCGESNGSCALNIARGFNTSGTRIFDVNTPVLTTPVALRYRLSGFSADGNTYNEYYSFCLISINEAPVAVADLFTVVRGDTLRVRGSDAINLLSNDQDDNDAGNLPLSINPNALSAPRLADRFELQTDGGFLYRAQTSIGRGTDFDSFTYEVTDGIHTSTASVTIRIVESNTVPGLVGSIPDITVVSGQTITRGDPSFDFSMYFSDPDGGSLQFSTRPGSLPPSGNLQLSPDGQLFGTLTDEDVGDYTVTVFASDGSGTVSDSFSMSIAADPTSQDNRAPVIEPINELVLERGDRVNVLVTASDPDGDTLTYELSTNTADFLSINPNNGRIRGVAAASGLYPVTVIVSDSSISTPRTFILRVVSSENSAPVVDDIANAVFDGPFTYDVSVFFEDPDGDAMTFSAISLPPGVTISADGIITGTPSASNAGPHFVQVTADDNNLGTSTDGFLLTLIP